MAARPMDLHSDTKQRDAAGPVRFAALDSWRGLAALAVVLFHSPIAGNLHDLGLVRAGEAFVDFFFVLSGFVIAHAYAGKVRDGRDLGRFLFLRAGRLLPLHLFMLGLFVLFELGKAGLPFLGNPADPAFSGTNRPATILGNVLLLQAFWPGGELSWNTPSWSISAEFAAYALFGGLLLRGKRSLGVGLTAMLLFGLAVLALASRHGMVSTAGFGWARALFGFAAGALIQRCLGGAILKLRQGSGGQAGFSATAREAAAVLLAGAFAVLSYESPSAYLLPVFFSLVVVVFAAEAGALSRLLKHPAFLVLGSISFSIYLTHLFVQNRFVNAARLGDRLFGTQTVGQVGHTARYGAGIVLPEPWMGDALTVLMLLAVVCVSLVTYRWIERPGQALFRNWAAKLFARAAGREPSAGGRNEKGRLQEAAF